MQKKKFLRGLSGVFAAVMLAGGTAVMPLPSAKGTVFTASAEEKITDSDIAQLRSKLNSLSSKADEYTAAINEAKKDQNRLLERVQTYENLISAYQSYIETSTKLAKEYSEKIGAKVKEIENKQNEYNQKYDYFLERLRATYEEGGVSYLQLIFSADSFLQMLESLERSGDLLTYDTRIMQQLEEETAALERERDELDALRAAEKENAAQYEIIVQDMETSITDLEKELETLKATIEENQTALKYVEDAEDKAEAALDAALKKYYAQQKAEEEARKKQEEQDRLNGTTTPPTSTPVADHSGDGTIWPLPSSCTMITSPYGYRCHPISKKWKMHNGTDIYAPKGTSIYAVLSGTVIVAGYSSSYGNYIVIDHGGGVSTLYAHCSSLSVSSGEKVTKGQTIAAVGMTGSATGYHLHLEWRVNGSAKNAMEEISRP